MSEKIKNKQNKKSKNPGIITRIKTFFEFTQDQRFQNIFGLACFLSSIYITIAFISFFFTWKADQSEISKGMWEFFTNNDIAVENWLKKLGAVVSHLFIYSWFGVASFIFPFLIFLVGFRLFFKVSLLNLRKTLKHSLFFLIWISITLAFFSSPEENSNEEAPLLILGGTAGYFMQLAIISFIGKIGTLLLILFSLGVYIIVTFNPPVEILLKLLSKKEEQYAPEIQKSKTTEEMFDSPLLNKLKNEQKEKPMVFDFSGENENKKIIDTPEEELKPDSATELPLSNETSEEIKKEGEPEFSIEKTESKETILTDEEIENKTHDLGEYDPTLDLSTFQLPGIELLKEYGDGNVDVSREELEANKNRIVETLKNYNIGIDRIKATIGPTVTLYEMVPQAGVRISKIKNLEDDIALSLSALGIRIIAPIPGRGTIGIEVPNQKPEVVSMRSMIASEKFQNTKMDLPLALGKTISNETYIADLAKMPHLLMAGATGQGKSVGLNAILVSLLYKKHPSQIKFVMVDPKKVELTLYNKIERHYLAKLPDTDEAIITDTRKVVNTLNSLCVEMDQRYDLLKIAEVRTIKEYNTKFIERKLNPEKGHKFLPYIVLVVDEFADLIMTAGKEVEAPIARLAQLARAIGIHLIIATQRPSVNIITGTIKANFPSRIAFKVTSKIDSRTILDTGGADQLIGRGDMLLSLGSDLIRLQCPFVDTPEVEKIAGFIGEQRGYPEAFILPEYVDENATDGSGDIDPSERDALFEEAARIVVQHQQGSASLLQRKLKLGYNRAGRIIDQLESAGIIGPFEGSKARQVLISDLMGLEQFLNPSVQDSNKIN